MKLRGIPPGGFAPFAYLGDPNGSIVGSLEDGSTVSVESDLSSAVKIPTEYPTGRIRVP